MTPLARQMLKGRLYGTEMNGDRLEQDVEHLFDAGWHYFDFSEVLTEVLHLAKDLQRRQPPKAERLAFMPFPKLLD